MKPDNVLTLTFLLRDAPPPGGERDKTSGWQGDRLSVLTPSALSDWRSVCVCVYCMWCVTGMCEHMQL